MGTAMVVNYANIFLDDFENRMLDEYEEKTGMRPLVWWRYIDDVFFIWHDDENSLRNYVQFCDKFSGTKEMKSKIRFESNFLRGSVKILNTLYQGNRPFVFAQTFLHKIS